MLDTWAENVTTGTRRSLKSGDLVWAAEKRDAHKLMLVKEGFLEVRPGWRLELGLGLARRWG